jgi:hypothetical protein
VGRWLIHNRLAFYADAARAMRLRQVVGRARRLIPPGVLMAGAAPTRVAEFHPSCEGLLAEMAPQSAPGPAPHQTQAFTAVGVTRVFSPSRTFWSERSDGLLFLFHLHGFASLPKGLDGPEGDRALPFWSAVLTSWLDLFESPKLPAWHPYPTSVRVIAWSAALSTDAWNSVVRQRAVDSLWRQAHYLRRSVEHDIGGNHVLKNTTALAFAGACFPDSNLLDRALRLLERELPRQFLADGGHEERSTSYHHEALHDLRQVAELLHRLGRAVPPVLLETVDRAETWSQAIAGPDLKLPLLNDSWEGQPATLRAAADLTVLPASGHVIMRHGSDQVVFDCGPLSPRHLPPHAHADALSAVAWFGGKQLAVDRGSFAYSGPRRNYYRATAAHNTVEIEGQNQCYFWGDFRAARLPVVELHTVQRTEEAIVVSASHDGYRRLPGRPIHQRVLVWLPGDGLLILDRIHSLHSHAVRSFLHLTPSAVLVNDSIDDISLAALGPLPTESIMAKHAPWLGTEVAAETLVQGGTIPPLTVFGWSLLRGNTVVDTHDSRSVSVRRSNGTVLEMDLPWPMRPGQ